MRAKVTITFTGNHDKFVEPESAYGRVQYSSYTRSETSFDCDVQMTCYSIGFATYYDSWVMLLDGQYRQGKDNTVVCGNWATIRIETPAKTYTFVPSPLPNQYIDCSY